MSSSIPILSAKEIVRILKKMGFVKVSQKVVMQNIKTC